MREYLGRSCWKPHQVILDFLAGGHQKVPDGGDEARQVRLELLIVFLSVQSGVVADLRFQHLQETRFFLVLCGRQDGGTNLSCRNGLKIKIHITHKKEELTSVCNSLLSKVNRLWKLDIQVSILSSKNSGRSCEKVGDFH